MIMIGRKYTLAHRYSYELHRGPIPQGLFCLHRCDNRQCVNPDHLFLGTNADNMQDCWQKGRSNLQKQPMTGLQVRRARGLGEPAASNTKSKKLSPEAVAALLAEYFRGGITQRALAAKYGVCYATAHFLINGKRPGLRRGAAVVGAKLNDEKVREIRRLQLQGFGCSKLGRRFGVSETSILNIFNGKTWKHIQA